jgi:hypothetical protein
LAVALEAVTRRPVDNAELLLPQVSRRSPLASWKALINAIAHFYRGEDDVCRRWLQAIAADSAPAHLAAPLLTMLGAGKPTELSVSGLRLVAATGGGSEALRPFLASLEQAMAAGKRKQVLEKARAAVSACDRYCPELREKLRQRIAIRCMLLNFAPEPVANALGGGTRRDLHFYHLMARACESATRSYESPAYAVIAWEEFRRDALKEKWFAANTPEDGVLSLHMAELVARVPEDVLEEMRQRGRSGPFPNCEGALSLDKLMSPDALYERSCRADPHPEAFRSWLEWARKQRDYRAADYAAERWAQTRPQDVTPLLWLMESSESRGAFKKSLKYLAQAEELDRVNPEVRKAKLRLLVAGVLRHLRQRKVHLARPGIDGIAALPETREGNQALCLAALRRICAVIDNDLEAAKRHEAEVARRLENTFAAHFLHQALTQAAGMWPELAQSPPCSIDSAESAGLLAGVARVSTLGAVLGFPIVLPGDWELRLTALVGAPDHALDTAQLLALGELARRSEAFPLSFAVSVAGLASGAADARFLFLRAQTLPGWLSERRRRCLAAALELARRERDMELAGKILDQLRGYSADMFAPDDFQDEEETGFNGHSLTPEALHAIIVQERAERGYPSVRPATPARLPRRDRYRDDEDDDDCNCPDCRRRRGDIEEEPTEDAPRAEEAAEEDGSPFMGLDNLDPELGDMLDFLPEEFLQAAIEALKRGESPDQVLGRILFGAGAPNRRQLFRRNRNRKGRRS